MKTVLPALLLFFCTYAKADTTTIHFTSPQQPLQSITLNSCGLLCIVNTSGHSYLLHNDTLQGWPGDIIAANSPQNDTAYFDLSGYSLVVMTHQVSLRLFYINVIQNPASDFSATICHGESYLFDGIPRTVSGSYSMGVPVANSACDSIVTLNLTVLPENYSTVQADICQGETYTLNGMDYTASGLYAIDASQAANGCDSTTYLDLTVHPNATYTQNHTICPGTSYTFGANVLTTAGTYLGNFQSIYGCDSVVTLHLFIGDTYTQTVHDSICPGDSYIFNGGSYLPGIYTVPLQTVSGCDSIVTLVVTNKTLTVPVVQTGPMTLDASAANASSYLWINCPNNSSTGIATPVLTTTISGTYAVQAVIDGCTVQSDCFTLNQTGLSEQAAEVLSVYPVPAGDCVTLATREALSGSKWELYDSRGHCVSGGTITGLRTPIGIAALAPGVYVLHAGDAAVRIIRE